MLVMLRLGAGGTATVSDTAVVGLVAACWSSLGDSIIYVRNSDPSECNTIDISCVCMVGRQYGSMPA